MNKKSLINPTEKLSIRKQCDLLEVCRSTVYVNPAPESEENLALMQKIDNHHLLHPCKGVLQMQDYLRSEGHVINKKRVRRLMRKMCLEAIYPLPNLSRLGKAKYVYPYLLRHMKITRPNQVWAIDITYIPMERGFMYLTAVIDVYSRCVLGIQLSNSMEASTQTRIVEELVAAYGKPEIINSDQGSQYTSLEWVECLKTHDINISMDGKGRATDNAFIERFFRTLKQECVYLNPTHEVKELNALLDRYVKYYNTERSHQGIGRTQPIKRYHNVA
jgi:putative transposase